MKKTLVTIIALGVSILSVQALANATVKAEAAKPTINSCARLLPEGRVYTISIAGSVNKTAGSKNQNFIGAFNLSSGSNRSISQAEKDKIKPFVACVSPLIK